MIPGRLRWAAGFSVLLAASAAASAAFDSPEDALKARGLKRVGSTYVLAVRGGRPEEGRRAQGDSAINWSWPPAGRPTPTWRSRTRRG